jgi:hypothetical protein
MNFYVYIPFFLLGLGQTMCRRSVRDAVEQL